MKFVTKILLAVVLLTGSSFTYAITTPTVKTPINEIIDRHLSGFSAVTVAGSFDVKIAQTGTESVKIDAPAEVMDHIITEVNNGVLKIYNKHDEWNWGNWWGHHKKIIIYVTVKNINSVYISGSGDVAFKDGLSANSLKLKISGSGDMNGKIDVKMLESNITGSGDMTLSGRAESSTVDLVGSGDYTAAKLLTVSTSVRVSGSGDAEVNASDKIDAAIHGSGDIHYTGAARNVSSSKTGSGDISKF
jgi:Putative auto-transporter adhesin, head GIN domain